MKTEEQRNRRKCYSWVHMTEMKAGMTKMKAGRILFILGKAKERKF